MGILEAELAVLDRLINEEGVGKEGEHHAKMILGSPEVWKTEKTPTIYNSLKSKPQWERRYARKDKRSFFSRVFGNKLTRKVFWVHLFYKGWRLMPAFASKRKAYSLLAPYFAKASHFLCLGESFWLENKNFVSKFFPVKSRTVITDIESKHELSDALRVPLKRFNMNSLEGWIYAQNVCNANGYILVIDGHRYDRVINVLGGTLSSGQSILVTSVLPSNDEVEHWRSIHQIKDNWWLLEGPPVNLLHPNATDHDQAPPRQGWPKISVVVVSFNQANYVRNCLDSVLKQKYPNLEFIVVDGDSTDGTKEILEEYREWLSHLIIEPDKCQSDALNKGFFLATGDVMTWVCSDDFLEDGALFRVGRTFAENKVDLVAGGCRIIDAKEKNIVNHHNGLPFGKKIALSFGDLLSFRGVWELGMYFYQPDLFFSRQIWAASGGYIKEHLYFAMDYDLFLRFAMAGASVIHIPEFLAIRRIHESQKTKHTTMSYLPTIRNLLKEYKWLIEKTIDSAIDEASEEREKKQGDIQPFHRKASPPSIAS